MLRPAGRLASQHFRYTSLGFAELNWESLAGPRWGENLKRPYYSRIRNGRIDLGAALLRDLYVIDGSTLYAAEVRNGDNSEWILSPVPPDLWEKAYKLKVNLSGKEGTLAAASEKLAELGVNIFTSTVTPVSAEGETSWTSVVELPTGMNSEEVELDLREFLDGIKGLSSKPEFREGLELIELTPLRALRRLASVVYGRKYTGVISEYSLPLAEFKDPDNNPMARAINNYLSSFPSNVPPFCLLSTDSAEKYARLTFPSWRTKLFDFEMLVRISSADRDFRGVFGAVVKALGDTGINIYSCENHMVEKRENSEVETARFSFSADLSRYGGLDEHRREATESKLFDLISGCSPAPGSKKVLFPRNRFRVAQREVFRARCFIATNAVPGDEMHDAYVRELLRILRTHDVDGLNVDITKSGTVRKDAELVLRSCPFLISLHLPSPSCRVAEGAKDSGLGETANDYAPSDWVMFEESYMAALDRKVYRFVHSSVRMPRYAYGKVPRRFSDLASLEELLQGFEVGILRDYLNSSRYRLDLEKCVDFAKDIDLGYLNRDLYAVHSYFD